MNHFKNVDRWKMRELLPMFAEPGHRVFAEAHGVGTVTEITSLYGKLAYWVSFDGYKDEVCCLATMIDTPREDEQ